MNPIRFDQCSIAAIACLWALQSTATATSNHEQGKPTVPSSDSPAIVIGTLVDATWFVELPDGSLAGRLRRAPGNLARGIPAAILSEEASSERDLWFVFADGAPLVPYVGKTVKVEGRLLVGIQSVVPTTFSVDQSGEWQQIQLVPRVEPEHAKHGDAQEGVAALSKETADHARRAAGIEHAHSSVFALPPAHPLLVNFTAGLLPAAVVAEWLGRLLRRRSLTHAAWWMLCFGAVITPLTAIAGWLWLNELGDMGHSQIQVHKWLGTSLVIVLVALAIWRARIHALDGDPGPGYLTILTIVLLAVAGQGHLGATMSFGPHGSEAAEASHEH